MNFQDLMDCYNISNGENNQIVYNNLLNSFKKQNITPVIGAGLSSWAYPLWSKMLEEQGANYGIGKSIQCLVDAGEYELAASALEEEVTPNGLKYLLQQLFCISLPEFPVKIYPTRNMGEEDEKSGEEAGKFGKKYAFQKARSRLKYNLSYFGGERDGKYHPAACWKIHISL